MENLLQVDPASTPLAIRKRLVDEMRQTLAQDPRMNPIRAMSQLYFKMIDAFRTSSVSQDQYPVNFTIGSLNPRTFAVKRDGTPDPKEAEFSDLAGELGLVQKSATAKMLLERQADEIEKTAWQNIDDPVYSGYDPSAHGTIETREEYLSGLKELGFADTTVDQAYLCAGGIDGIMRTSRTLYHLLESKKGEVSAAFYQKIIDTYPKIIRKIPFFKNLALTLTKVLTGNFKVSWPVTMGFPTPGFMMAANAAKSEGLDIIKMPTKEEDDFFPTTQQLFEQLKSTGMDALMLTPFGNPSTTAWKPDKLKEFLNVAKSQNPDMKYVFDMAYINTVSKDTAKGVVKAIYESEVTDHSVFVFSRSKEWAQPRLRSAMILALDPEINKALNNDTLTSTASQPYAVDFYDRVLQKYFNEHPEVLLSYNKLLRQRQVALLDSLKKISQHEQGKGEAPIFDLEYLNRIVVPGTTKDVPENAFTAEVPLYLFVKLRQDITAWNLAEKYGIIAVPGPAFDGDENMVRFSIGTVSTSDIDDISKQISVN